MVVSFLLSVIGGVTTKQSLASQITGLGNSAEEFVLNVWDGKGFSGGLEFTTDVNHIATGHPDRTTIGVPGIAPLSRGLL